jgi:hypothetical protein
MLAPSNRRVSVTPQRRLHLSGRRPSVEPDKPNEADGTVLKLWQIYADVWDWNMHQVWLVIARRFTSHGHHQQLS